MGSLAVVVGRRCWQADPRRVRMPQQKPPDGLLDSAWNNTLNLSALPVPRHPEIRFRRCLAFAISYEACQSDTTSIGTACMDIGPSPQLTIYDCRTRTYFTTQSDSYVKQEIYDGDVYQLGQSYTTRNTSLNLSSALAASAGVFQDAAENHVFR